MISEPPGEPYYIGRIMGFKHKNNNNQNQESMANIVDAKNYNFQIQWFYRPRDISKTTSDSRLLFASMHTDSCPISSFRGLVEVRHKQDIEDEFNRAQAKRINVLLMVRRIHHQVQPQLHWKCMYKTKSILF